MSDSVSSESLPHEATLGTSFDRAAAAKRHNLSDRQRAFADALLLRHSKTEAARIAGYSGDGAALRSTASKVSQSAAVRGYMAAVIAAEGPTTAAIGDTEENLELLWEVARGGDNSARIRACEAIERISARREAAEAAKPIDPVQVLARMALVGKDTGGLGQMLAKALAAESGIPWSDVEKRLGRARAESTVMSVETPGDAIRRQHIERMNQNPLGAVPPPPSSTGPGIARGPEQSGGAADHTAAASPLPQINPHGTGTVRVFGE